MSNDKSTKSRAARYHVVQVDDEGERVLVKGAKSAELAAKRAAALDPAIDVKELAESWNCCTDGARYMIGWTE